MPNGLEKVWPKIVLRLVALRHVDEIARQQLVLVKGRGVGFEPALVFEPALDKVEGDLRQPPLRHAVQVFDIDGFVDLHLCLRLPDPCAIL